ncbi:MAG: DUF4347 domain-containing protein [Desmonostoc vinosum HA7617-LM4]|jgi:hypothetical protein|nr:DUF4347 domain-containing protein [Desmonostoc vinosum HA7617-LM4]
MLITNTLQFPTKQLSLSRLVFIDSAVKDYQSLAAGVLPDTEVIILDAKRDTIAQISQVLLKQTGKVNSLHISPSSQSMTAESKELVLSDQ